MGNKQSYINYNSMTIKHKNYTIPFKYIKSNIHTKNTIIIINNINKSVDDIYGTLININTYCNVNLFTFDFNLQIFDKNNKKIKNQCQDILQIFVNKITKTYDLNPDKLLFIVYPDCIDLALKFFKTNNFKNQIIIINPLYSSALLCCSMYNMKKYYKKYLSLILLEKDKEDYIYEFCNKHKYNNVIVSSSENFNLDLCDTINKLMEN